MLSGIIKRVRGKESSGQWPRRYCNYCYHNAVRNCNYHNAKQTMGLYAVGVGVIIVCSMGMIFFNAMRSNKRNRWPGEHCEENCCCFQCCNTEDCTALEINSPEPLLSSTVQPSSTCILNDFIAAAKTGDLNKVCTLLEADRSLLEARDEKNKTGFHWAAMNGHEHVVDYLLSEKADVNVHCSRGRSVLISASEWENDNTSVIETLIKAGCNVNDRSDHEDKTTALSLACAYGHVNNVRALLRAGADVNLEDGNGLHPIHYAAEFKSSECITLLLHAGANVNALDNSNGFPIMRAVYGNKPANIRFLKKHGGHVDWCNINGDSALHIAVMENFDESVDELLKLGCDRNIKNKEGKTALDIARENKQDKIIALVKRTQLTRGAPALQSNI